MTDTLNALVAANIRAELARRRIRHEDLAEGLNLTRPAVSRLVNGQTDLTLSKVEKIARYFDVDPHSLLRP